MPPSRRSVAIVARLVAVFLAPATVAHAADDLLRAAQSNNATVALAAIEDGVDVNARSPDGTTPLHWAVYNGNLALVERLIAAGADVSAANEFGSTPLAEAATVGNAEVIEALLTGGAAVDAPGADGQTALMVVARSGNAAAAEALIAHGANVNARELWREQTALMWAAAQSQPAMVALLIEHGAEVDARSVVNEWPRQVTGEPRRMYRPFGGLTPLLFATREGCLECVRALVEAGANVDLPDPKGVTPLFLAIDNFHFDTAKLLIEAGANPNKWDWWGRTPLYSAVDVNTLPHGGRADRRSVDTTTSTEIIELLLEAGAWPNVQLKLLPPYRHIGDDRGCDLMLVTGTTPLLRAAKTFDTAAIELLIEHDANVDLPNDGGITPVMAAAGVGSVECDARGYGPGIPHYLAPDSEEQIHRRAEVAARRRREHSRAHPVRPRRRPQPRPHGAVRRRVLGLERRRRLPRRARREDRRRGARRVDARRRGHGPRRRPRPRLDDRGVRGHGRATARALRATRRLRLDAARRRVLKRTTGVP